MNAVFSTSRIQTCNCVLTAASLSKRAKSSFRVITNSCAVHWDARLVKPSMSANKMLQKHKDRKESLTLLTHFLAALHLTAHLNNLMSISPTESFS